MNESKRRFVCIALATIFVVCTVRYVVPANKAWADHFKYPAPPFTLMSTENKKVSLSDFRGKKVLLIFWESYCVVCIKHMKQFSAAYRDMDHDKLVILGITAEKRSIDAIRKTVQKLGVTFPILKGGQDILKAYTVYYLPTIFLIDEDGDITHVYSNDAAVENIIKEFKDIRKK